METEHISDIKNFLVLAIFGLLGSLMMGFIFFRQNIFDPYSAAFQFVVYGFAGSIIFTALKLRSIRDSILFTAGLFLLNLVIFKTTSYYFILRDICFFSSLWLGIYIYVFRFKPRAKLIRKFRAFGLGVILALTMAFAGIILLLINMLIQHRSFSHFFSFILLFLKYGMLIGLGLGIGFDFGDVVLTKLNKQKLS